MMNNDEENDHRENEQSHQGVVVSSKSSLSAAQQQQQHATTPTEPTISSAATSVTAPAAGGVTGRHRRRPRGVLAFLDDSLPLTLYPYNGSVYWRKNNNTNNNHTASSPTEQTRRHASAPQSKKQRRRQLRRLQEQHQQQQQQQQDHENDAAESDATKNASTPSCQPVRTTKKMLAPLETIIQRNDDDHDCSCRPDVVVFFLFDPQQAYSQKVRNGLVRVLASSCRLDAETATANRHDGTTTTTTTNNDNNKSMGCSSRIICLAMPAPGSVNMAMPVVVVNDDNNAATSVVEDGTPRMVAPSSPPPPFSSSTMMVLDEFLHDSGFYLSTYTASLAMVLQSSLGHKVPSLAVIPTSLGRNVAAMHEELALEWNNQNNDEDTNVAAGGGGGSTNAVAQAWLSGHSALGTVQQITTHILFPSCTIQ